MDSISSLEKLDIESMTQICHVLESDSFHFMPRRLILFFDRAEGSKKVISCLNWTGLCKDQALLFYFFVYTVIQFKRSELTLEKYWYMLMSS